MTKLKVKVKGYNIGINKEEEEALVNVSKFCINISFPNWKT